MLYKEPIFSGEVQFMKNINNCALILGGDINGYSIIRELSENGVEEIVLFENKKSLASMSNKIVLFIEIDNSKESLRQALNQLRKKYNYIIIFSTNDHDLENLNDIYHEIIDFCFVPINHENLSQCINKYVQYQYCNKYQIPYPKTQYLETISDVEKIPNLKFPLLVMRYASSQWTTSTSWPLAARPLDKARI